MKLFVNAYTQFYWRGDGVLVDCDAIRSAFREVKKSFPGKRIGYPMLDAGLGGGDWTKITAIIDEELDGETHTLVEYQPWGNRQPSRIFAARDSNANLAD